MVEKLVNGLTEHQMFELKQVLLDKKKELTESILFRKQRDAQIDPNENIEELDQAAASQHQAVQLRVLDKETKLLQQVEHALRKFELDQYGLCEGTEEPIGYARLKARPWARYSIVYKEEQEKLERQKSARLPGR